MRGQIRRADRAVLGVALPGVIAVVTGASLLFATPAGAQVSETPSPSPAASATPSAEPQPSPSADTATPSVTAAPSATADPTGTPDPAIGTPVLVPKGFVAGADDRGPARSTFRVERRRHRRSWAGWSPNPRWGTYGTAALDRAARVARSRGWSEPRISRRIYAPFIVEGPATWSDSWGAPRFAGGYHPHHGQDVLCAYGAPVLAVERGTIAFGRDGLGGLDAYLQRADGSFWYYAHLKSYAQGLATGDRVRAGMMIGRCGATGDATVPHVHFAYFAPDRMAVDPMPALVAWLNTAERRLHAPERRAGTQLDAAGLLHLPSPDREPPPGEAMAPAVLVGDLPWSARDRFLLTLALLSPLGWAAVAVAVRRRRAIDTLMRG
jgi:murein DD-endopeptidase MepM/ murein hydrolase activator NlpD